MICRFVRRSHDLGQEPESASRGKEAPSAPDGRQLPGRLWQLVETGAQHVHRALGQVFRPPWQVTPEISHEQVDVRRQPLRPLRHGRADVGLEVGEVVAKKPIDLLLLQLGQADGDVIGAKCGDQRVGRDPSDDHPDALSLETHGETIHHLEREHIRALERIADDQKWGSPRQGPNHGDDGGCRGLDPEARVVGRRNPFQQELQHLHLVRRETELYHRFLATGGGHELQAALDQASQSQPDLSRGETLARGIDHRDALTFCVSREDGEHTTLATAFWSDDGCRGGFASRDEGEELL